MLYNVKLSDFEPEQIDFAIALFEDKIEAIQRSLLRLESWDESQVREDLEAIANKHLNIAMLFKVQLLNAKSDIKEMNKVNEG